MRWIKLAMVAGALAVAMPAMEPSVAHAAKPAAKAKKKKQGPGMCGTYMYWKGGKCLDARAKK